MHIEPHQSIQVVYAVAETVPDRSLQYFFRLNHPVLHIPAPFPPSVFGALSSFLPVLVPLPGVPDIPWLPVLLHSPDFF